MSQGIHDLFAFLPQQKKKKKKSKSKQKSCPEMADEKQDIRAEQIPPIQSIPVSIIQCLNQKQWEGALHYLEPLLDDENDGMENIRLLVFLLWRSECFFEINDYESCAEDCRRIIHLLPNEDPKNNFWFKSRLRLIFSLLQLETFEDAKSIVQQLSNVCEEFIKHECVKLLERIEGSCSQLLLDNEKKTLTTDVESNEPSIKNLCVFCNLHFENKNGLENHYSTKNHHKAVICDEGREWKKRPPPQKSNSSGDTTYNLCPGFISSEIGECDNGTQCENAHGIEEFNEWRERLEYRKMKLLAEEALRSGKSYTELFLKRSTETSNQEKTMRYSLEGVDVEVDGELTSVVHTERCDKKWIFKLHTTRVLKAAILLDESYKNNFRLNRITATLTDNKQVVIDEEPPNPREWISQQDDGNEGQLTYKIEVLFVTKSYGTFSQTVLFNFGPESLVKKLNVSVIDKNPGRIKEMLKELGLSSTERWTSSNALIIPIPTTCEGITNEEEISTIYSTPTEQNFHITKSIKDDNVTAINYRSRMHQLSLIEEMACYEQIAKFNIPVPINVVNSLPSISGVEEKVAANGELFAILCFNENISEDSPAGRLLLNNCTTVLVGDSKKISKKKTQDRNSNVYQALIEDIGRNIVYLRLSAQTVTNLKLKPETKDVCNKKLVVQFQLNRYAFCKWHQAIDRISDLEIIFPDLLQVINLPVINKMKWTKDDSKLNEKQKKSIAAITSSRDTPLPPVLILGPFGTGKTYALVQAIKHILLEENTKILICTHSNSAADVYIEEYLHPLVTSGVKEATPLRIYHREHRVISGKTILKYCLIEIQNNTRIFKTPSLQDVLNHRIIVSTLDVASYLSDIDLPEGHFTHILIDEAAQALECEALIPLALANKRTRVVLAGDPTQLGSEVFSSFAIQKKFNVSLLQRLYEVYPPIYPEFIFSHNYKTHKVIVEFISNIFYNNESISTDAQPQNDKFYPLNFFCVKGQDVQEHSGFRNSDEAQELIKRVIDLKNNWPASWGKFNENSIAVLTPYQDQTDCIRLECKKYKSLNITIENISDVRGKQFRVVFLSTVRTGFTCVTELKSKYICERDYGFLSNEKLINTALTRAQSLMAVVGDPVSLCIFGKCRHIWMKFIDTCSRNNSLHGLTLAELKYHLFEIERRRTAAINLSQPPYSQATTRAPSGFSYLSFPTPYPAFAQMPYASGTYMPMGFQGSRVFQLPHQAPNTTTSYLSSMNLKPPVLPNMPQAAPTRSTMFYMPQYQFGFGVYPSVPQYTQSPSLAASPSLASFNKGANSTSVSSSQCASSKSPSISSIASEASSQSPDINFSANPVYRDGVYENDSKMGINYSNLKICETDNSLSQFMNKMETKEQEECNELLAKAIISSGSPLNLVENEYFKEFLQKLRPSYDVLDEKSLRKTHLDQEFDNMTARLHEIMENVPNIGLRIDSWSYERNKGVINIILSVPEPILYKCIRTTEDQHTDEYTLEIVSKVIEEIGSERVFEVICHNAAYVTKSKELFAKQFPHIATTHCLAITLNSIMNFTLDECTAVKTIRQQCFNLVNAIKKSRILSAAFAKIKKEDSTRYEPGLILPVPTQWETLLKCFESIVLNKSVLKKLVQGESVQNFIEDVNSTLRDGELWSLFNNIVSFKSMLLNDSFWNRLDITYTILKPMVKWILILDEDKCRITDVVDVFKDIKNGLEVLEKSISTCIPVHERIDMIQFIDEKSREALSEIHFAAYFLNPANTLLYEKLDMLMTSEEISSAFRYIHNMSLHSYLGVSTPKIMNEIAQYRTKKGPWKDDFLWENVDSQDFDPICWWEAYCSNTELSKIAIPILEMPITSAFPERSFSEISIKRNPLPGEDATKITYIAHNMDLMARTKSKFNNSHRIETIGNSEDEFIDTEPDQP